MTKKHFRGFKKFTKKRRKYQKGGNCCDYETVLSPGCPTRSDYFPSTKANNARWFQCGYNDRIYVQNHVKKHIDSFYGDRHCLPHDEAIFVSDFTALVAANEGPGGIFRGKVINNVPNGPGGLVINDIPFTPTGGVLTLSRAYFIRNAGRTELVQFTPQGPNPPGLQAYGIHPEDYGIYGMFTQSQRRQVATIMDEANFDITYSYCREPTLFGAYAINNISYPVGGGFVTDERLKLAVLIFFKVLLRIHTAVPALVITNGWPGGMLRTDNFSQMTVGQFIAVYNLSILFISKIIVLITNNNSGKIKLPLTQYTDFINMAVNYITDEMVRENTYEPNTNWEANNALIPAVPAAAAAAAPAAPSLVKEAKEAKEARRKEAEERVKLGQTFIIGAHVEVDPEDEGNWRLAEIMEVMDQNDVYEIKYLDEIPNSRASKKIYHVQRRYVRPPAAATLLSSSSAVQGAPPAAAAASSSSSAASSSAAAAAAPQLVAAPAAAALPSAQESADFEKFLRLTLDRGVVEGQKKDIDKWNTDVIKFISEQKKKAKKAARKAAAGPGGGKKTRKNTRKTRGKKTRRI